MTNKTELRVAMLRAGFSQAALAAKLGISSMSLSRKIHGSSEFKASEIQVLHTLLGLTDAERTAIFFAD